MKYLIFIVSILFTFPSIADENSHALNDWGMDIGFGQKSYVEDIYKLGLMTPHLFSWAKDRNHSRLTLEYTFQNYQSLNSSVSLVQELSLFLRTDASVYEDLISAYSKIGFGIMLFDNELYEGTPLTVPVSIGLNVIIEKTKKHTSTFYIEYQVNSIFNYDDVKSLPGNSSNFIERDTFSTNAIMIGTNFFF